MRKQKSKITIITENLIILFFMLMFLLFVLFLVSFIESNETNNDIENDTYSDYTENNDIEFIATATQSKTTTESEWVSLGEYKLTAYCVGCCCNEWSMGG